jgi:hypothetical protein
LRREDVFDDSGRFTEAYLRQVAGEMIERLGWTSDQAEGYVRVPQDVLRPVAADLSATLGWTSERAEVFALQQALRWAAGVPRIILVAEAVQQRLHDDRVDTAWPACPQHPHHPLWLTRTLPARWRCATTGEVFCNLGELAKRVDPKG